MSDAPVPTAPKPASTLRKVFAAILDFLTIFMVGGYLVALLTGRTTDGGFKLEGWSSLVLLALVVAYFYVGRKYLGGTLWQRLLRAY